MRVAQTAQRLAEIHGYNQPEKAYLAGLLHDLARELSEEQLLLIAQQHQLKIPKNPILLHGEIGRILTQEHLAINDPDILNAIANHTLGRKEMGLLEKIIFIADFIEPERNFTEAKKIRETAKIDLNKAVAQKAVAMLQYAKRNGRPVEKV